MPVSWPWNSRPGVKDEVAAAAVPKVESTLNAEVRQRGWLPYTISNFAELSWWASEDSYRPAAFVKMVILDYLRLGKRRLRYCHAFILAWVTQFLCAESDGSLVYRDDLTGQVLDFKLVREARITFLQAK